jgi:hypothetical protein
MLSLLALIISITIGFVYGRDMWPEPPPGQPEQMWSKVEYELKFDDPFFHPKEWIYPARVVNYPNHTYAAHIKPEYIDKSYTARCFVWSGEDDYAHSLGLCQARFLTSSKQDLLIRRSPEGASYDKLSIRIRNGNFVCIYWNEFYGQNVKWVTTEQKLIIDKSTYKKNDEIKGKIEFKCILDYEHSKLKRVPVKADKVMTVKISGVFKAKLK